MSEREDDLKKLVDPHDPNVVEHGEQKSITGSGQTIGIVPADDLITPTMALDSLEDSDD